jgi:hypothetical protein
MVTKEQTMTTQTLATANAALLTRTLSEGYGPGAWHGADLKAAVEDVDDALAFARPAAGRHNIAEIVLHHAFCARSVRERLTGRTADPFILPGDDWFTLPGDSGLSWQRIREVVEEEQRKLSDAVSAIAAGAASPLTSAEQFDLALGITCHAIYHAGQVELS